MEVSINTFEQQEMVPKSPKEAALALKLHIEQEKLKEIKSFEDRALKHDSLMEYFDDQLKNCETVLAAVPDEDGVIQEVNG